MYPLQQGKSVIIQDIEGKFRLAKTSNGTERYPRDAKGNEYYLQWDGKPLLLRKPNGEHYLAHNRKGFQLIPWNLLAEYAINNEPYLFTKDVLGNNVYVRQSELPQRLSAICQCDRVVVYSASTPQVWGSLNGLRKVDSAFHLRYIGSINEYQACFGSQTLKVSVQTDHQIGTSVHAPQHPMVTCIMMGTVVPGPHGLLCH
ncbi:uncharacterized protein TNCV_3925311 [Trichonephila clavipes]|nr:uncharacterized protein TNCV_3925311 [Trichonephila clavipes]